MATSPVRPPSPGGWGYARGVASSPIKKISSQHDDDSFSYIDRLISSASLKDLEAAVQISVQHLNSFEKILKLSPQTSSPLQEVRQGQTSEWLKKIQQLRDDANPSRILIGVVGNTGAGKSSLINALLGEERLVPTNGMRACTASATEISYNHSDDPAKLYRAEIEFISQEDWTQELGTLLSDILVDGQLSGDCKNPDTIAGVSYSKIKAVYPKKSKETIIKSVPAAMAQETQVYHVLGTVKHLAETTASALYEGTQKYVDSKERVAGKRRDMEYWPLIKSIRIYCKAAALSTGAVIVDLPGVQDSNAARAAVSENYIKLCNEIWITTAIQRAVDDKSAKKLLGDSFRRQLKFDGSYSAITFICTKTDDFLQTEIIGSLGELDNDNSQYPDVSDLQHRRAELDLELSRVMARISAANAARKKLTRKSKTWNNLHLKLKTGHVVYRPQDKGHHKKPNGIDSDSDLSSGNNSDSDSSDSEDIIKREDQIGHEVRIPLTQKEVENELMNIKAQRKDNKSSRKNLSDRAVYLNSLITDNIQEEQKSRSIVQSNCIKARNEYSRGVIRNDFALGIKELDQETAEEEDELLFDPSHDVRDYEKLSKALPVFCVSARAYQKLIGNLQNDSIQTQGFLSVDDTEIPQLQKHAKQSTEAVRANKSRYFLNELNELLNSMKLWSFSGNHTLIRLSKTQRVENEAFVLAQLCELTKAFLGVIDTFVSALKHSFEGCLYNHFHTLSKKGSEKAVDIANAWGDKPNEGGLRWPTYRATVSRLGVFHGSAGPRDFNAELFEPVSKGLLRRWEMVFQDRFPTLLHQFMIDSQKAIEDFHLKTVSGIPHHSSNPYGFIALSRQVQVQIKSLEAARDHQLNVMIEHQRSASRMFEPAIQKGMTEAYNQCLEYTGKGSFLQMKNFMKEYVENAKDRIFEQAMTDVKIELTAIPGVLESGFLEITEKLVKKLERDFKAVLVGEDDLLVERKLRDQLRKPLKESDLWFTELFLPGAGESC